VLWLLLLLLMLLLFLMFWPSCFFEPDPRRQRQQQF
jgi:hypothetical protein